MAETTITLSPVFLWAPTKDSRSLQTVPEKNKQSYRPASAQRIQVPACLALQMKLFSPNLIHTFFFSSTIPRGMDFSKQVAVTPSIWYSSSLEIFLVARVFRRNLLLLTGKRKQKEITMLPEGAGGQPGGLRVAQKRVSTVFPALRRLLSVRKREEQNAAVYNFLSTSRKWGLTGTISSSWLAKTSLGLADMV